MSIFGFGATTPKHPSRQDQINALKTACPFATQARDDPNSFDVGLRLPSGETVRLRT